jgi:hypothetical protein
MGIAGFVVVELFSLNRILGDLQREVERLLRGGQDADFQGR